MPRLLRGLRVLRVKSIRHFTTKNTSEARGPDYDSDKGCSMKIKYLGHAAFVLTSRAGTRVVLDPNPAGAYDGAVGSPPINETAEIVLVSHDHPDHGYAKGVKGRPNVKKLGQEVEVSTETLPPEAEVWALKHPTEEG
jgi:hypothetical protein